MSLTKKGSLLLAIDGGGTKTHCVVGDSAGNILGEGFGGPSNHQVVGTELCASSIKTSIVSALSAASAQVEDLAFAYLGLSGADFPEDTVILSGLIAPILGSVPFQVANDAWIALLGGCPELYGAALICGTGTNAVARSASGTTATLRSQDYRLGNYGGGPHLAEQALHQAFRADEGTGPATQLTAALPKLLGLADMESLFRKLFGHPEAPSKSELDTIPPLVFRLATEGDAVCQELLVAMGTELGAMAAGVCLRAGLEGEFPLVLAGSLFAKAESPLLADAALLRIHRAAPGAQLRHLSGHPVYGALAEAGRLATSLK